MTNEHRIKIAFTYDEWARVSRAVSEAGTADNDGHLFALAARIEREMGHYAVAGTLEAAATRAFGSHG
jgi:hypothetical protein|nr:hypothetical protein [Neorhizobium tomejilense]